MNMRLLVPIALAAAIGVVAVGTARRDRAPAPAAPAAAAVVVAPAVEAVPAVSTRSTPTPAAAQVPRPRIEPLSFRLAHATDLRVFAQEAAQHPEQGGITYAAHATGLCRVARLAALSDSTSWDDAQVAPRDGEDSLVYGKRVAVFDAAKAACRSFTADELGALEDLDRTAAERGDTLRLLADTARSGSRSAGLAAVLGSGDPLLLQNTLERLLLVRQDGKLAYRFDGTSIPVQDASAFSAAVQVLPCRLGLPCGPTAPEVLQACLQHGQCAADKIELLRSALAPQDVGAFDAYLAQLVQVVQRRQVERLL